MKKKVMLSITSAAAIVLSLNAVTPILADTTSTPANSTTAANDQTKPSTDDSQSPNTGNNNTGSQTINTADLNKAISLRNKYAKLTKTSYVYNGKGERVKNEKLKKGTVVAVGTITTTNGKVLIGYNGKKNRYISVKNVELFKAVQYKLKTNAYVYDLNGQRNNRFYIKKGAKVIVTKTKKINGVKYVVVNGNYLIKWSALDKKSAKVLSA